MELPIATDTIDKCFALGVVHVAPHGPHVFDPEPGETRGSSCLSVGWSILKDNPRSHAL